MRDQHLAQWFRQMAVLHQCGISTLRSLEACGKQTSDPRLRSASDIIRAELMLGQRLTQAMEIAGPPFNSLHLGALEVGQRQGDMALVFERLAHYTEESFRIRRRILAALSYPTLVTTLSLASLYFLVRFLAPVLSDVARQLGHQPTGLSQALLWLGELFASESVMLSIVVLTVLVTRALVRHLWRHRRRRCEDLILTLPLLGKMLRLAILIRISSTLEMMIGAGLPLTEALTLSARCCGSERYADEVLRPAVERVRRGESLRSSLIGAAGLPPSFIGMVLAGEESGRLEKSFHHLARLYELELVSAIDSGLAALEPIAIAVVGSVVLSVLLVVFVPLSHLVSAV